MPLMIWTRKPHVITTATLSSLKASPPVPLTLKGREISLYLLEGKHKRICGPISKPPHSVMEEAACSR